MPPNQNPKQIAPSAQIPRPSTPCIPCTLWSKLRRTEQGADGVNDKTLPTSWASVEIEEVLLPYPNGKKIRQGWSPQCENHPADSHDDWAVPNTSAIQDGTFATGDRAFAGRAVRGDRAERAGDRRGVAAERGPAAGDPPKSLHRPPRPPEPCRRTRVHPPRPASGGANHGRQGRWPTPGAISGLVKHTFIHLMPP